MTFKRIAAIFALILLAVLYIAAIFFAATDNPATYTLFKAAIFCTVVIPVLIYGYMLVYRFFGNHRDEDKEDKKNSKK